jgi:hypothetical protein
MWKCERHIPTSKVYPEIIAKCPACGFARPDAAYRPPMFPEEEKPVVRIVPPPPRVEVKAPPPPAPTITWADDPEPELDEEPGPVVPEATPAPKAGKRPKDIPVTEKSKAHLCPGPKCRKVSRRNSPYCSKICSDKCLRLRKKATEKVLDGQEVKWLNRILAVLEAWGSDKV